MSLTLIFLFIVTEAMFSASPGPAVAMVISASIMGGKKATYLAIFGVLVGNLIYFIISAGLLTFSLSLSDKYFQVMRWLGVLYIIYILYKEYIPLLLRREQTTEVMSNISDSLERKNNNAGKYFYTTLTMQLANPKTIVFFTAFLPQFINLDFSPELQFLVLAILSFVIEFIVLYIYAMISMYFVNRFESGKLGRKFEHIGNFTMILAVSWGVLRSI